MPLRINSLHPYDEHPGDIYPDPPQATLALLNIEPNMPHRLHDPCAGTGNIVRALRAAGHEVTAADVADLGCEGVVLEDFLTFKHRDFRDVGCVFNPPFRFAESFIRQALVSGAPFIAALVRLNFLESTGRRQLFEAYPPQRVHVSQRRLQMHRLGWSGPKAAANWTFCWMVWCQHNAPHPPEIHWFDWKDFEVTE
jgi:hypothetical protein